MNEVLLMTSSGNRGQKALDEELAKVEPKLHPVVSGVYLGEDDPRGRTIETTARPILLRLGVSYLISKCTAGVSNHHQWVNMFPHGSSRAGSPSSRDLYILVVTGATTDEVRTLLSAKGVPAKRVLMGVLLVSPPTDAAAPDFGDYLRQVLQEHKVTYAFARLYNYSSNAPGLTQAR